MHDRGQKVRRRLARAGRSDRDEVASTQRRWESLALYWRRLLEALAAYDLHQLARKPHMLKAPNRCRHVKAGAAQRKLRAIGRHLGVAHATDGRVRLVELLRKGRVLKLVMIDHGQQLQLLASLLPAQLLARPTGATLLGIVLLGIGRGGSRLALLQEARDMILCLIALLHRRCCSPLRRCWRGGSLLLYPCHERIQRILLLLCGGCSRPLLHGGRWPLGCALLAVQLRHVRVERVVHVRSSSWWRLLIIVAVKIPLIILVLICASAWPRPLALRP